MKKPVLILFLALLVKAGTAQNHYRFEQTTAAYQELTGATPIQPANFSSGDLHPVDLTGETFWLYGIPFPFGGVKTFHIQTNGNIRIDNDSALVIFDGAFTFLDSIDGQTSLSYKVEGSHGNKVIKVQWKNLKMRNGIDGNYMNMQIRMYQKTGVAEVHYGSSSASNQSGFSVSKGPNVGIFFSRDDFSKMFGKLWVNGSPSAPVLDSSATFIFKAMSGLPPEGTVYRFIPTFTQGLGIAGKPAEMLHLYPNPAAHFLKAELQTEEQGQWEITDLCGKTLLEGQCGKTCMIPLELAPGTYFYRVALPGKVLQQSFIVN